MATPTFPRSPARVAWVFGLLPPLEWPPEAEREAAAGQVDYWNRLVAIEQRRRDDQEAIYRQDPQLAAILSRIDDIGHRLAAIPWRGADEAGRARRRDLQNKRSGLWRIASPLRAAVRDARNDEFRALNDGRYQAIKRLYAEHSLWWCNKNAVAAAFDVALGRLGLGQQVRPHNAGLDAKLTNQIQGGIPAAAFLAHGHAQAWLGDMPKDHPALQRGAGRRGQLRLLTVTYTSARTRESRKTVSWPLVLHRDFPPGAIIKTITVHRHRITAQRADDQRYWRAVFTLEIPPPAAAPSPLTAGVDIGWRLVHGGVRIATIYGSDASTWHVVLPEAWLARWRRLASDMPGTTRHLINRLAALAGVEERRAALHAVQCDKPSFVAGLEELRAIDLVVAHGRNAALAARREIYRCAAKEIADKFGLVAIDADVKTISARASADETELPPPVRRMRAWCAPAELVVEIARAVKARGGRVLYAKGASTATCWRCGHLNNFASRGMMNLTCGNCGELWDQDYNAARVLCQLAGGASTGAVQVKLAAKENKGLRLSRMTRKKDRSNLSVQPP